MKVILISSVPSRTKSDMIGVIVMLLGVILKENSYVMSITHTLGFCVDCFPELEGSSPKSSHQYIIAITSLDLTNWLHIVVRRADLLGRIEGAAVQAIDQNGLPIGRFGLYQCQDGNKYIKATKEIIRLECDFPNDNMREHPNAACFDRRNSPPKELHMTWRFSESDSNRITSIQFKGLVVENFAKQKSFSNVTSPKIIVNPVSSDTTKLAWLKSDLEGNCHRPKLSSQWTLSSESQEINGSYVTKIKNWKALI